MTEDALRQALVSVLYGLPACNCCVGSATTTHTADVIPTIWPVVEPLILELSSAQTSLAAALQVIEDVRGLHPTALIHAGSQTHGGPEQFVNGCGKHGPWCSTWLAITDPEGNTK